MWKTNFFFNFTLIFLISDLISSFHWNSGGMTSWKNLLFNICVSLSIYPVISLSLCCSCYFSLSSFARCLSHVPTPTHTHTHTDWSLAAIQLTWPGSACILSHMNILNHIHTHMHTHCTTYGLSPLHKSCKSTLGFPWCVLQKVTHA